MSHHSVESMRDIAFRKGRHGFSSDDDYLRALRGEELEDEFLDEEDETPDDEFDDEENETPDDEFDDEEDETPDGEDETFDEEGKADGPFTRICRVIDSMRGKKIHPFGEEDEIPDKEDEPFDEDEMVAEFEDVIFRVVTESSNKTVNVVFDWIMKVEDGRDPGTLTFIHNGTTVRMSVAGEDLVFGAVGNGADCRGRCDFDSFLTDIQDMLMDGDTPYCAICGTVENILYKAREYAGIWKNDIAKLLAGRQSVLELHATRNGNDTRLRFVRRSLVKDDGILWVLLNPTTPPDPTTSSDTELKYENGHPARLLQWLFERNNLIDVLRPE